MRHGKKNNKLNRDTKHRMAMLRNLVVSLVEHERIHTTLARAKELRSVVEKAVTKGKGGTLHNRRTLLSKLNNPNAVSKLMDDLAPRMKDRKGGYTRILKSGSRDGDKSSMAYIEFVDYVAPVKEASVAPAAKAEDEAPRIDPTTGMPMGGSSEGKTKTKVRPKNYYEKRKALRKMQRKSRQINR